MFNKKYSRRRFIKQSSITGIGSVLAANMSSASLANTTYDSKVPAILGGSPVRSKEWPVWPQWDPEKELFGVMLGRRQVVADRDQPAIGGRIERADHGGQRAASILSLDRREPKLRLAPGPTSIGRAGQQHTVVVGGLVAAARHPAAEQVAVGRLGEGGGAGKAVVVPAVKDQGFANA